MTIDLTKPESSVPGEGRSVTLFSDGLLSKFGFCDGEVLNDPLWDMADDLHESWKTCQHRATHPVLVRAVREYLLPVLQQDIVVYELVTIHNPIRATRVDGVGVDEYGENAGITLTPYSVDVPLDVLYQWWVATAGADGG